MKVFVSYAFNDANKWVEQFAIPLITALGFEVVDGRHMAGEPLAAAVDARLQRCGGCVAFTTRRNLRADNSYESHPWVVGELNAARAMGQKIIEVREANVALRDANDHYVHLGYVEGEHAATLVNLARELAPWKSTRIRIQLVPPDQEFTEFRKSVARAMVKCSYEFQREGEEIDGGEAKIMNRGDSCFVEIEVPSNAFIKITIKNQADNSTAWASNFTGLDSIAVKLL